MRKQNTPFCDCEHITVVRWLLFLAGKVRAIGADHNLRRMIMLKTNKLAFIAGAALLVLAVGASSAAEARPAWFGPGSGPISPYKNFRGFNQVPRQTAGTQRRVAQPVSNVYRCVPNVGLVGANGVCPD
jgi:hypothetical protein